MSDKKGWVSIHRSLADWEWYQDANVARVFLDLLITVNHKDGRWQGRDIKAGSTITSPEKIGLRLGLSRQKVRTALDKLKESKEVTIKTSNKNSLISIVKWLEYQGGQPTNNQQDNQQTTNKQPTDNQQITNKQPTDNQRITTNNNENNAHNENNENNAHNEQQEKQKPKVQQKTSEHFDEFWKVYPKKAGRKICLKKWIARGLDKIGDEIISDVMKKVASDREWLDGYPPNPQTYINGDKWEDEVCKIRPSSQKPQQNGGYQRKVQRIVNGEPVPSGQVIEGELANSLFTKLN